MMDWRALHGDCLAVLPTLPADSVDAVVTDPPYELGFMGRAWDRSGIAFRPETWAAVMRTMRPGAHLAAFGGARTQHRMICAIEDAGFEVRDTVLWLHGQGFPKGKACLKPAFEPIVIARKPSGPLWLNIDACRVATDESTRRTQRGTTQAWEDGAFSGERINGSDAGRWPANIMHDGSPEVLAAFAAFGEKNGGHHPKSGGAFGKNGCYGRATGYTQPERHSDTGTAARFFYCAKASKAERAGSKHPTVKPLALMRWLCRLITPPGGLILDPFAGSGTTMEAAHLEGFGAVGIELEAPHMADIRRRYERVGAPLLELAQAAD